jgi:hypothetical protein
MTARKTPTTVSKLPCNEWNRCGRFDRNNSSAINQNLLKESDKIPV